MQKIGTFTIIKNESEFIGYHIMSILDYVDEMVFADGNSTDGTIEIIEHIKKKYDRNNKIKLFKDKDCKNLQKDYVRLFNWTIKKCSCEYVWFIHPDMICVNPEEIKVDGKTLRYNVNMLSFAHNRETIITEGRTDKWATIYKNDFGLHYYGYYGSIEEDLYFKAITGDEHIFYKKTQLPYEIKDSSIQLYHYCDTKPYKRRLGRMLSVMKNLVPDAPVKDLKQFAMNHPRVTLQKGVGLGVDFSFKPFKDKQPDVFDKYNFERFRK